MWNFSFVLVREVLFCYCYHVKLPDQWSINSNNHVIDSFVTIYSITKSCHNSTSLFAQFIVTGEFRVIPAPPRVTIKILQIKKYIILLYIVRWLKQSPVIVIDTLTNFVNDDWHTLQCVSIIFTYLIVYYIIKKNNCTNYEFCNFKIRKNVGIIFWAFLAQLLFYSHVLKS